jgi:hypothetical protein
VRESGRLRRITLWEAILLRIAEDALKGNTKSAAFLFNRYAGAGANESAEEGEDLTDNDRQVLDTFVRRLQAQHSAKEKRS